jgi:hypothetical protein
MRKYRSDGGRRQPGSTIIVPIPGAVLLVVMSALVLLIGAASASANNDPHRVFLPSPPFDFGSSFCGFPVHAEAAVNREYGKVSTLPDGSTFTVVTGSRS